MIGIQEIIDLTAPLHGGNRLADQIFRAQAHNPIVDRTGWNHTAKRATTRRPAAQLIAMPIIADELRHFIPRRSHNQAA